jgi:hypothetical protein
MQGKNLAFSLNIAKDATPVKGREDINKDIVFSYKKTG